MTAAVPMRAAAIGTADFPGLTMNVFKRKSLLAMLALPAGCAIQFLSPLATSKMSLDGPVGVIRPPAVGQSWNYGQYNFYNSQRLDSVKEYVVSVNGGIRISRRSKSNQDLGDEFQLAWGLVKQDSYWDSLQTYEAPIPLWPDNLSVGNSQSIDTYYQSGTSSFRYWISAKMIVMGWEKVTLPCGTFKTVRIEKQIRQSHHDISRLNTLRRDILWFAPEIGRWVVRETNGEFQISGRRGSWTGREDHFRWQLESWT